MSFVTGDRKLDRKLTRLSGRDQRRLVRNSQNKGGTVVLREARSLAPKVTRAASRALGKRFSKGKADLYTMKIGMGVGRRKSDASKAKASQGAHGVWVILGTVRRYTKSGADRGVMPSNDFVFKALRRTESKVKSVQIASLSEGIAKLAN